MITVEDRREALRTAKRILIAAHDEISGTADFMESRLPTEADMANCKEYGIICRVLGVMEEQITSIGNQLTKLK